MQKEIQKKFFLFFRYLHLNWLRYIGFIKQAMVVIGSQSANKKF